MFFQQMELRGDVETPAAPSSAFLLVIIIIIIKIIIIIMIIQVQVQVDYPIPHHHSYLHSDGVAKRENRIETKAVADSEPNSRTK